MTDIETLRALIAAATPWPWVARGRDIVLPDEKPGPWSRDEVENVRLIVAAVNALPALLDELERHRQTPAALTRRAESLRATGQDGEALALEIAAGMIREGLLT